MRHLLKLPDDPVSTTALARVTVSLSPSVANHSIRSFLLARIFAESEELLPGVDYDDAALYFSCLFHDLGTGDDARGEARFEVESADMAGEFLLDAGWDAMRIDSVWEAIALHTSPGIAERRSLLTKLTREGVNMDFGSRPHLVPPHLAGLLHDEYPRMQMVRSLVDAVVAKAALSGAAAPRYSLPGELLRERSGTPFVSRLEMDACSERWHECTAPVTAVDQPD